VAKPLVPSTEISQRASQGAYRKSPEIPVTTVSNETATTGDLTVHGDPRSSRTSSNIEKSGEITNTEAPAKVTQNVENIETHTQPPNSEDPQSSNMEIDNMQTRPGPANAAGPQSSTHSTNEIPIPLWLSQLLHHLQSVSHSVDWQNLVSGFTEFEKLEPPRGVSFRSLNNLAFTSFLTCFLL